MRVCSLHVDHNYDYNFSYYTFTFVQNLSRNHIKISFLVRYEQCGSMSFEFERGELGPKLAEIGGAENRVAAENVRGDIALEQPPKRLARRRGCSRR